MKHDLENIKAPVAADFARYEDLVRRCVSSEHRFTQAMLDYILDTRGKGIRPLLTLLSAAVLGGGTPLGERSLVAAMLVEMTHTASLIHDDVIDEAAVRRGKPTVKAMWHSPRAVIIGDFILSKTFSTGILEGGIDLVSYVVHVISGLCEGEMIQSEQNDRGEMSREIYYDIIYKKTACLLGRSCGVGALSVEAGESDVARITQFGDMLGMAFQIRDDMLDYMPDAATGKIPLTDIREGKITIPLLSVLETASEEDARMLSALLAEAREDAAAATRLCREVTERGGLRMSGETLDEYTDKALEILLSFPDSPYRRSLERMCGYLAGRMG